MKNEKGNNTEFLPSTADELLGATALNTYQELIATGAPTVQFCFTTIGTKGAIENMLRERWEHGFDQGCQPTEEGRMRLEKEIARYLKSRRIADDLYYFECNKIVMNILDMSFKEFQTEAKILGAIGTVSKKWSPKRIADEWKRVAFPKVESRLQDLKSGRNGQ